MKEDKKGKYTFTRAKGNTIIDYVMGNTEIREKVKTEKVGDRIDSDHQPIKVEIKGNRGKRKRNKKGRNEWRGYGMRKEEEDLSRDWAR